MLSCFKKGVFYELKNVTSLFTHKRRQIERNKLAREKQLREAAEREKAAMEQRLMQYQEEIRLANEALVVLHSYVFLPKTRPRLSFEAMKV